MAGGTTVARRWVQVDIGLGNDAHIWCCGLKVHVLGHGALLRGAEQQAQVRAGLGHTADGGGTGRRNPAAACPAAWRQPCLAAVHVECRQGGPGVRTCDTTSTSTVSIVLLLSAGRRERSEDRVTTAAPRQPSGVTTQQQRTLPTSTVSSRGKRAKQQRPAGPAAHLARGWCAPPAATGARRRSWPGGSPWRLRRAQPPAAALLAAGRRPRPLAAAAAVP